MIVTHEWDSTPHNSPSIKRVASLDDPKWITHDWVGTPYESPSRQYHDGVLNCVNYGLDPALNNSITYSVSTSQIDYTVEHHTDVTDGPSEHVRSYRRTVFSGDGIVQGNTGYTANADLATVNVDSGDTHVGVSFWLRFNTNGLPDLTYEMQNRLYQYTPTTLIEFTNLDRVILNNDEWTYVSMVLPVLEGLARVRFWSFTSENYSGREVSGTSLDIAGYSIMLGSSESDVATKLQRHFDGDTPTRRGGKIVAINRVDNPSFETGYYNYNEPAGVVRHLNVDPKYVINGSQSLRLDVVEGATSGNAYTLTRVPIPESTETRYVGFTSYIINPYDTGPTHFRGYIQLQTGGSVVESVVTSFIALGGKEWIKVKVGPTAIGPEITHVRTLLWFHGSAAYTASLPGTIYTDAWNIIVADEENEVNTQLEHYFDGDSPNVMPSKAMIYTPQGWVEIKDFSAAVENPGF